MLASVLGAIGFFLAFRNPAEPPEIGAAVEASDSILGQGEELAPTDPGEPVELTYRSGGERKVYVELRQDEKTSEQSLRTRLAFVFREKRKAPDTDEIDGKTPAVTYRWAVEDVQVTVAEGKKSVAEGIVAQVDALLQGTRQLATYDAAGLPLTAEWTSVTNPQVRESLALLRYGQNLLLPRLRRGAVNAGEQWVYKIEARAPDHPKVPRFKGEVRVETTFEGVVERGERRLAVLDRRFEVSGAGKVEAGEEGERRDFEITGDGTGTALFDIDAGQVVESRITMERKLLIGLQEDGEPTVRGGTVELFWGER